MVEGILSIDGGRPMRDPGADGVARSNHGGGHGARDHLRYLGPSHAGMSKASVIENEVGLGDIWARRDENDGYAD